MSHASNPPSLILLFLFPIISSLNYLSINTFTLKRSTDYISPHPVPSAAAPESYWGHSEIRKCLQQVSTGTAVKLSHCICMLPSLPHDTGKHRHREDKPSGGRT